jgi:hypothetical protein
VIGLGEGSGTLHRRGTPKYIFFEVERNTEVVGSIGGGARFPMRFEATVVFCKSYRTGSYFLVVRRGSFR